MEDGLNDVYAKLGEAGRGGPSEQSERASVSERVRSNTGSASESITVTDTPGPPVAEARGRRTCVSACLFFDGRAGRTRVPRVQ